MAIEPIIESQGELTHSGSSKCPVVLSTRLRLARNLAHNPFPNWCDRDQAVKVRETCLEKLSGVNKIKSPFSFRVEDVPELERQLLVERHLISRELADDSEGGGMVISKDQTCSIMVNEEDHLRIQVIRNGTHFKRVWNTIDEIDNQLAEQVEYAFSPRLGFLTACPSNLGTGLRASVMMHLPGLVLSNQMEKVIRAVNQLGIAVRGLYGEGSDASGSIFQLSNQQTLGESEEAIIRRLDSVLKTVVEREEDARQKMLENDPLKLYDKIGRAFGILRSAYLLNSGEAMNLLSLARLAVDRELLDPEIRTLVDRMFIECQPGHIQFRNTGAEEPKERDRLRAKLLRDAFSQVSLPGFDKMNPQ